MQNWWIMWQIVKMKEKRSLETLKKGDVYPEKAALALALIVMRRINDATTGVNDWQFRWNRISHDAADYRMAYHRNF